jgi:2-deoxy-D-gluconate 3-dehydrogenase
MTSLSGKVAVITGAGRGIGRGVAVALAQAGADVVLASRTQAELDIVAAEITASGQRALAVSTDVTNSQAVDALVARSLDRFGRVDILVNNSGVLASRPLLDQEPDEWNRVISTNLGGAYLMTRAVGRHLVQQKAGKVVNIASNFGVMGVANHAAYSASKAGIIGFTRSMGVEWARYNVQVNAVAPGYIATELNAEMRADQALTERVVRSIPARRMGEVSEVVPWVLLLAGPGSDFMTGETIVLDGGMSAR